jgi:hypothetical protein
MISGVREAHNAAACMAAAAAHPPTNHWQCPHQQLSRNAQQRSGLRRRPSATAAASAVAAAPSPSGAALLEGDVKASKALSAIITYALELARASETYEVTSWGLLLGILRYEECTAAKALRKLGLDDLYGAWHEVMWALSSAGGLTRRAFQPRVHIADRAEAVLVGALNFAVWGGRDKVQSEDLLMALAAGGVLDGLFPDLRLRVARVRGAVQVRCECPIANRLLLAPATLNSCASAVLHAVLELARPQEAEKSAPVCLACAGCGGRRVRFA